MTNSQYSKEIRFSVWAKYCGKVYSHKCPIDHCKNIMKVSDFDVHHVISYSECQSNLMPICINCRTCMRTKSITEYNNLLAVSENTSLNQIKNKSKPNKWCCFF